MLPASRPFGGEKPLRPAAGTHHQGLGSREAGGGVCPTQGDPCSVSHTASYEKRLMGPRDRTPARGGKNSNKKERGLGGEGEREGWGEIVEGTDTKR